MALKIYSFIIFLISSLSSIGQGSIFQFGIVIDEIMADPTPVTGLPDAEWVELKNTSGNDINLLGWRLGKPSAQSGPMPSYLLKADSFLIVCTGSAVAALSPFSPVISVTSFPSLANGGDLIYLKSPQGGIIHSVNYTDAWYRNELKRSGGWSLEMIDTKNPCSGSSNWAASIDSRGGTPGKTNSIDGANPDATSPRLLRAYAIDSLNVVLVFNEGLDSIGSSLVANYTISDGISIGSAIPLAFQFDRVQLRLVNPMIRNKIYTVNTTNSKDCSGNLVSTSANSAKVGLSEPVDTLDIVVNEILFNPRSNGTDFVELYNRSTKILNLKNIYVANRGASGDLASIAQVSIEDNLFFPGDFIVLTEDVQVIKDEFVTLHPEAFVEMTSLPSYNDDKGSVVVLNELGKIIDEVNYNEKWHFKLINNNEGISLERIDYYGLSNSAENWHSAAASVSYATPTYRNSQLRLAETVKGEISISPAVFSPDNDGLDDFATIQYTFPQAGYVANVTIFDAAGRAVRYLQRNSLSGSSGTYRWDGLDERNIKLPVGLYIVYTEIFNLDGQTKRFKNTIVLARKN